MTPNDRFKKSTSSFVTALYEAYVRADSSNSRRIEQAFPHLFDPDVVDFSGVELRLAAVTAADFAEFYLGKPFPYFVDDRVIDPVAERDSFPPEKVVIDKTRDPSYMPWLPHPVQGQPMSIVSDITKIVHADFRFECPKCKITYQVQVDKEQQWATPTKLDQTGPTLNKESSWP